MFLNIFLQAQPQQNPWMMPALMIGMVFVMYFFMIRPQQKKAKEQKKFAEAIGTGDRIVTTSGIHGKIVRTNDDGTILVEVDRNTNITMERQVISMDMTQAYNKKANNTPVAK